jgi:hypothetical protein
MKGWALLVKASHGYPSTEVYIQYLNIFTIARPWGAPEQSA